MNRPPFLGNGGGRGDQFDWDRFNDNLTDGFASVNQTLAGVAEAVVKSNETGSTKVADAARDVPSLGRALEGGRVSQSRVAA